MNAISQHYPIHIIQMTHCKRITGHKKRRRVPPLSALQTPVDMGRRSRFAAGVVVAHDCKICLYINLFIDIAFVHRRTQWIDFIDSNRMN